MKAPEKADDLELLKRAPAIAELQNISSRYGLNLTSDQANAIIDRALEPRSSGAEKTDRQVKMSVRNQLFRMLAETDPKKAMEIKVEQYEKRGFKISESTRSRITLQTGRIFESKREARAAYRKARRILRQSLTKQTAQKKSQVAKAPAAEQAPGEVLSPAERKAMNIEQKINAAIGKVSPAALSQFNSMIERAESRGINVSPAARLLGAAVFLNGVKQTVAQTSFHVTSGPNPELDRAITTVGDVRERAAKELGVKEGDLSQTAQITARSQQVVDRSLKELEGMMPEARKAELALKKEGKL